MPKKQKPNPYTCFVEDYMKKMRREHRCLSKTEAFQEASPLWKALSLEEKALYEAKAKETKLIEKKVDRRLDSLGNSVSQTLRKEQEMEQARRNMIYDIRGLIQSLGTTEAVAKYKFYIISFNYYCKTQEGVYYPAEVGLVEFSIQEGVTRTFHEFIEAEQFPLGYAFTVKDHSESSHKIPSGAFEGNHLKEEFAEIITPLCEMTENFKFPIFSLTNEMAQTQNILERLYDLVGDEAIQKPLVYDLSKLFFALFQFACSDIFSDGLAAQNLSKTCFSYSPNVACSFHEEVDTPQFCSLGIAKRSCFLMADVLCCKYNIAPIPNKHVPEIDNSQLAYGSYSGSSRASVCSDSFRRSSATSSVKSFESYKKSIPTNTPGSTIVPTKSSFHQYQENSSEHESVRSRISISTPISRHRYNDNNSISGHSFASAARGQSHDSFSIDSGDFPILGSSISGRESSTMSVRSAGRESSRASYSQRQEHNPVFSTEVSSVSSIRSGGDREKEVRMPNSKPGVINDAPLKGIGRGRGIGRGQP